MNAGVERPEGSPALEMGGVEVTRRSNSTDVEEERDGEEEEENDALGLESSRPLTPPPSSPGI